MIIGLKNLIGLKIILKKNNSRPLTNNKDIKIMTHGQWLSVQKMNYKLKKGRMKDNNIYNEWTKFINNDIYKKYLI